jgi:small GTP-binding protein
MRKCSLKAICVGASGVGKTSLIGSYFSEDFQGDTLPTVAAASLNATVTLDAMQVDLQIWDTAGQERFQSISKMFYRDAHVAFVCYDSVTIDTIDSWTECVRTESPDCVIFLVTTKSDLLDDGEIGEAMRVGALKREATGAKLHALTSAKTGNGVRELFTLAAKCAETVYQTATPTLEIQTAVTASGKTGCC